MKRLYQTAFIVTVFSVAERGLGFLYRIVLSRTIGSEGVGLYQIALTVLAVFITATSSGIPITLSRLIPKYRAENNPYAVHQCVSSSILLTLAFCIPISLFFWLGHDILDFLFTDERCIEVFYILLPGLTFTSVYAVLRGSFWGNKDFMPYSIIELIEEMAMIVVGSILVIHATDAFDGAKRAGLAVTVSYLVSFTIALFYFFLKGGKLSKPGQLRPLLSSALPVTAMRTSTSLINSLIAILFPLRLAQFGMSEREALSSYGVICGMSMPILTMPSTVIGSIALVLVPELSENFYKHEAQKLKDNIERAIRTTVIIVSFLIPVFAVLGEELGMLLYSNALSGQIIQRCCILLFPMSLNMITTSILNSLHCEKQTLMFYFAGAVAMLACIWLLPASVGVYSLCIGMGISHLIGATCDYLLLRKKTGIRMLGFFLKALFLLLPVTLFGFLLSKFCLLYFGPFAGIIITGLAMVLFQTFLLIVTGMLPFQAIFGKKQKKLLPNH